MLLMQPVSACWNPRQNPRPPSKCIQRGLQAPDSVGPTLRFSRDIQGRSRQAQPQQMHMENVPEDFHNRNVPDRRPKLAENVFQDNGLVERHAYSVTDCAEVLLNGKVVRLIRVWNPWGFGEWKGSWNDRCPLWKELSKEDRVKLQRIDDDGEFWMCWEDFIKEFSRLIICNQIPDFLDCRGQHKKWYRNMFRSRWTKEQHLSWKQIDKDFFSKNPLYSITVTASDKVESGANVVVSLMQASRNPHKYGDWLPIGFVMFKLPDTRGTAPTPYFTPKNISSIKYYTKQKVTEMLNLAPGRYGIIPYTTQKEHESSFLFQVFLKSEDCTDEICPQTQSLKGVDVLEHESIFKLYATKGSKFHVWDLKRLLNDMVRKEYPHPFNEKFSSDGCREILASADTSKKGKLDTGAFFHLWKSVNRYKDLFCQTDAHRCGYINLNDLRKIILKSGLNVNNDLLQQLFARYSDIQGKMSFVDFLVCTMRLKSIIKMFYKLSTDGKAAYVQFDKWVHILM